MPNQEFNMQAIINMLKKWKERGEDSVPQWGEEVEEEEGKERRETWGWPMEGLDSEVAARKGGGTQKGSDSGKINPPPKTRYDKGDRLHWGGGFHHPI